MGVVAGGSDGVGVAFAREMASRGINVVLVARPAAVLAASADDIRARYGVEVAAVPLDHLADGPTWICGSENPAGGSPFGALNRRDAVLAMSRGASASKS